MDNQQKIQLLLDHFYKLWNSYALYHKGIQKRLKWDDEVRSNFVADIVDYFKDTLPVIETSPELKNQISYISFCIAFLQIIFCHQDFIDELSSILKTEKSSGEEKTMLRNLRNELVGHPIRRAVLKKDAKMKSSVFWVYEDSYKGNIEYLKYSAEDNFKFKENSIKSYEVILLKAQHYKYLEENLERLIEKLKKKLKDYLKKDIQEVKNVINKPNEKIDVIYRVINQRCPGFLKDEDLYNEYSISKCIKDRNTHPRYEHTLIRFIKDINQSLIETETSINEDLSKDIYIKEKIEILYDIDSTHREVEYKKDFQYELSKLLERHPLFTPKRLKNYFSKNEDILKELENMEINYNDDFEYYNSWHYLKKLIETRNMQS